MARNLPLDGVRVVELAGMIPGPYATMLMGDLRADVVKVEAPDGGDYQRHFGPETDGVNHRFATYNRNKRSVAIDLKTEKGHQILLDLLAQSDVVLESFRPGVVDRLEIDHETVTSVNPEIVYCSLSGYGQSGPYRDWPGHDVNYLGIAGLMDMTGQSDGPPTAPGYPIADFAGGLVSAFAIMAALRHSDQTGEGEYIDVSMTDIVTSWATQLLPLVMADADPTRGKTLVSGNNPTYNVYECADGKYITIGALEPQFWEDLCSALGLDEFATADLDDEDIRAEVFEVLERTFATRTRDEWLETLDTSTVPVAPVNSVAEALQDDTQVQHRDLLVHLDDTPDDLLLMDSPFQMGSNPDTVREPAPGHGDDTDELLDQLGYEAEQRAELRSNGILR